MQKPKRRTVKSLVPEKNLPLSKQALTFVTNYLNSFDLKEAACRSNLLPEMGERLFREPRVKLAIQRRVNLLEAERAKIKAQADLLTVPFIDTVVYDELKNKKNPHVRIRAAELAYRRTGLIRDGEFVGISAGNSGGPSSTRTYGQIQTTTVRRTTTEELVQSKEASVTVRPQVLEY